MVSEKPDFFSSVRVALCPVTEMNFFSLELKVERIVNYNDCLSLSCGMLVYNVLKSYVETEWMVLF